MVRCVSQIRCDINNIRYKATTPNTRNCQDPLHFNPRGVWPAIDISYISILHFILYLVYIWVIHMIARKVSGFNPHIITHTCIITSQDILYYDHHFLLFFSVWYIYIAPRFQRPNVYLAYIYIYIYAATHITSQNTIYYDRHIHIYIYTWYRTTYLDHNP